LDGQLGVYPVKFLEAIVKLDKCLKLKRERVNTLKDLNAAGERRKSFGEFINEDFQRKYAATVLDLSVINRDLNEYLKTIREFSEDFSRFVQSFFFVNVHGKNHIGAFYSEAGPTIEEPKMLRASCTEDAYELVNSSNQMSPDRQYVENPRILELISSLTSLMLQVKHMADGGR
jgi:seryl-tRNA synthetase